MFKIHHTIIQLVFENIVNDEYISQMKIITQKLKKMYIKCLFINV